MTDDDGQTIYPEPWRTDFDKLPTEGWVWIADTDGDLRLVRGPNARNTWHAYVGKLYLQMPYVAWCPVEQPIHPFDAMDLDRLEEWVGGDGHG